MARIMVDFKPKLYKVSVFVLLFAAITIANGENRTLKYIYTALSLPSKTQIPEFTAMGLLDHMQLDYFDSKIMTKLPRKPWMLRELGQEYFDKGTQSRRNKMQWFKVNLDILMKRMHQNNTDIHVLQWEHGCEADQQPNGTIHFMRGIDRYSYDGHDFLDYDMWNDVWVSTLDAAKLTKDKWNQVKELISYTDGYLKTECMSWLKKFSDFEAKERAKENRTDKPELYIFSKKSVIARNHVLTCLATGLPSKNVHLEMRRNNRVLDQTDGLNTLQLSPNHDETFQQRSYVELLRSDKASFSCHVPKLNLSKTWDGKLPTEESNTGIIAGAVVAGLGLILVAIVIVMYIRRRCEPDPPPENKSPGDQAEKVKLLEKGSYPGPASSIQSEDSGTASSTASSDRSGDPVSSGSTSSTEFLTDPNSHKSDSANESPDSGAGSEDGGSSGASTPPRHPRSASSIRSKGSRTDASSDRSGDPVSSGSTSSTEFLTDPNSHKSDSANESPDSGAGSEDGGSSGASTPPSERRVPV
ncbi:patr class I histocompatibility antigen, B-1 alpha chain-like [Synchiropus splendidus]|uniref:patr class I histocompatibility antigen, B-1 alpha chain-like n=1 Tax=Synchiropus splendidus TaxID=270530 RepID=UPI00237E0F99|nr:patr class I histocompatibility antigen, B-1 alpha chain-like [Synchiropus splendidus]